jgi:hypothetical protein
MAGSADWRKNCNASCFITLVMITQSEQCVQKLMLFGKASVQGGDQVGRIFAIWPFSIVVQFFANSNSSQNFGPLAIKPVIMKEFSE